MLVVFTPVLLTNYDGSLLVYDSDDMTMEWHTTGNIKNAVDAGLEFANVGYFTENSLWIDIGNVMYMQRFFRCCSDAYRMDDVLYTWLVKGENTDDPEWCHVFISGNDCLVIPFSDRGYAFPESYGFGHGYIYGFTPPVYMDDGFGFYVIWSEELEIRYNTSKLHYAWHDFATSPIVKHSKALCSKVSKMLALGAGMDEIMKLY